MQPIRPRFLNLLTTTLTCAAVLMTAGCDSEPLEDDSEELLDEDLDENPPFEPADELTPADEFAPPPSEPAVPYYQLTEDNGMLIAEGQDYRVRIHRSRQVVELNVSDEMLSDWYSRPFSRWAPGATRRLYQVFADDFDFIVFSAATVGQHHGLPHDGESVRVSNDIQGLGLSQFDRTDWYGSQGRLQSAVMLGGIDHVVSGPSLRELGERWGNALVLTSHVDHFGFSDVGGQLGGCSLGTIESVGEDLWYCDFNGTTKWSPDGADRNDRPYAELELYLMGLVPAEAVPPITWAEDGEWVDPNKGLFTGTVETADINDLRAVHGKRYPAHDQSPREFRTLFVVLSSGELIDYPRFHHFDARVREFAAPYNIADQQKMYNFYEATSGLARLDTKKLDASLL